MSMHMILDIWLLFWMTKELPCKFVVFYKCEECTLVYINLGDKEWNYLICACALRLGEEGKMYLAMSYKYRSCYKCQGHIICRSV
jgi:hypothetical protein